MSKQSHRNDARRKRGIRSQLKSSDGVSRASNSTTHHQQQSGVDDEFDDSLSRKVAMLSNKENEQQVDDTPERDGGDNSQTERGHGMPALRAP